MYIYTRHSYIFNVYIYFPGEKVGRPTLIWIFFFRRKLVKILNNVLLHSTILQQVTIHPRILIIFQTRSRKLTAIQLREPNFITYQEIRLGYDRLG